MTNWAKKGMPVLGYKSLLPFPWGLIEPHREQAMENHGQTLEQLAERGGLSPSEMLAVLEDRPQQRMRDGLALEKLGRIVTEANRAAAKVDIRAEAWTPTIESAAIDIIQECGDDAAAWAKAFCKTFPNSGADEGMMLGWFANTIEAACSRRQVDGETKLTVAREAFLNMLGEARRFEEDVDGETRPNGSQSTTVAYFIMVDRLPFEELTEALGINWLVHSETLMEVLQRAIDKGPQKDG